MPRYTITVRETSDYSYEVEADSLEDAKKNYASGTEVWGDAVGSPEIVGWEELGD